ncbi:hypothetical protein [Paenibacillus sp. SYP-B4298]|uniref:hypothetical protein n=1 Tax=Paenibacillus sp. SYP-B4298 TaxID=2996034 RepID=UPI0022DCF63F|nr:hypothetical protein [Paenibacillus sp. SYP-B4298]
MANPQAVSQAGRAAGQPQPAHHVHAVLCRKCKSQQVVANKRGYSFANMFKTLAIMILLGILPIVLTGFAFVSSTSDRLYALLQVFSSLGMLSLFLSLPLGIIVGFAGRNDIVNGCMNCGFKWRPAKKK